MTTTKLYNVADIQKALEGERAQRGQVEPPRQPAFEVMSSRPHLHLVSKSSLGPLPPASPHEQNKVAQPGAALRPLPDFSQRLPPGTSNADLNATSVLPVGELLARGMAVKSAAIAKGTAVNGTAGDRALPPARLKPPGPQARIDWAARIRAKWQYIPKRQRLLIGGLLALPWLATLLVLALAGSQPTPAASMRVASKPGAAAALRSASEPRAAVLSQRPAAPLKLPAGATLERAAADAAAEGRYPSALDMYEELARTHPDRPVFRAAARVLARRLEASSPTR